LFDMLIVMHESEVLQLYAHRMRIITEAICGTHLRVGRLKGTNP